MLRRLEEKTGIKASPHMLRHYFANARRKDGWKLELISQALGHRNIETTMKYLNITDEELIEVSDAFYSKHQAMYGRRRSSVCNQIAASWTAGGYTASSQAAYVRRDIAEGTMGRSGKFPY